MIRFALALVALSGCATIGSTTNEPIPDETEAVVIIWHDTYHMNGEPPAVRWRQGAGLTCVDEQSGKRGFLILENGIECREGLTWDPWETTIAWHGETSYADTALAHELEHASLLRRGILTGHHARPDFFTLIDQANDALRKAGL